MSVDRNAADPLRLRRNQQRGRAGGITSGVTVTAPLSNTGSHIQLNLDSAGGLESSSSLLRVKLIDTSISRTASGIGVALKTNGGLQISSGLGILLNGASLNLGATGLKVTDGGIGATQLGILTTKGDLLGFSTLHARVGVGANNTVLTADSTAATGWAWKTSAASPNTTKGDLATYDTASTRLPVGPDGTLLKADSGQSTGLVWAKPGTTKLFASVTNSNVYNTSTAETQFDQLGTLPANSLAVGDLVHARFSGGYIQASGTITLRVYIGTSNFLDFGAFTPSSTGAERSFTVEVSIVVGAIGASGIVRGTAVLTFNNQAPVVKVSTADFAVDTTADKDLKMTGQWSISSASNSILLRAVDIVVFR